MKFGRYIIPAVVAMGLLVLLPSPAWAGLRVTNPKLEADVSPGEVITHAMTVGIRETDSPMDIAVEVRGLGEYSAANFITIDKPSFHLEPGDSQDVIATISVPSDVGDGGRYAVINIRQGQPTGQGPVGILVAVDVPVRLTIKGSTLSHTGKITEITTGKAVSGQPVEISTSFQNTGNHHFKIKGEVTISDAQGKELDTIYLSLTPSPIVPGLSAELKATYIPRGELPLGVYSIKYRVMLEDSTVLSEASGRFEVEKPYVPPPPPASITLTPGSAAILKTTDGRIAISFPQGAVLRQVELSLRNYPLEQVPAPPAGSNLATTVFRIDGLTGLLAKEATVTVKYTAADLDKAGGDASRLRLARWDEAGSQWTVLKTSV
ncbi:MAG: hypothetical protein Q7T04_07385, partial [Dehalococcoidia bacterium]|nr:hypothetical protein [Dehalococcoidia bacterium]